MTRIHSLRRFLGLSQAALAERLGVSQPTVWRMEAGQPERGAVALLLDHLALAGGFPDLTAAAFAAANEIRDGSPVAPGEGAPCVSP